MTKKEKQINILYICPLIPAISGSGGKRAAFNHLLDLNKSDANINAIFIDVDDSSEKLSEILSSFKPIIFKRALPKIGDGFISKLSALVQIISNPFPRSVAVVSSEKARGEIKELLSNNEYDLIIIDHLNAYGLINNLGINL